MRTISIDQRAVGFLAAITAALALAACGPADAPGVAAPSAASTSASSAPPSSSSAPSPSSDPSTSSSSSGTSTAGQVCNTSSTIGPVYPESIPTKPFGTTGEGSNGYSTPSVVQVAPQKPRVLPTPSNTYELDPGMQYVAVDTRINLKSGDSFFLSNIYFNLFDAGKHTCYRTSFSSVISGDQLLRTTTLNSTKKDASGSLLFQVPVGTDLNTLVLAFGADSDYTPVLAWKG